MSSDLRVKVICFYTPNTPYQQEVIHLQASCANFDIPIEVEAMESRGSWEKNVAMKPEFILRKIESSNEPLLWVDADGAFLKKPDFSQFAGADLSVRFMELFQNDPRHAINAATLFINKTEAAAEFARKWAERAQVMSAMDSPPPFIDQIALYEVLLENTKATILPLPVAYCKIFDLDTFFIDDEHVIIEQRQASRTYRRS